MDTRGEQVGQRLVDQPLPRDAVEPGECRALHRHREMRFAAAVIAEMAGMEMAFVDHFQPCRVERGGETGGDDFGERGGGDGRHAAYISPFANSGSRVARENDRKDRPNARFHGRIEGAGQQCMEPGCDQPGEFRAPPVEGPLIDGEGPRPYRWFCLDHVRAFNARYNFFSGMTADEIHDAQRPFAGWERETRAFAANAGDRPPRWADFSDPLDAIAGRFGQRVATERKDGRSLSGEDRRSLGVLGLDVDADRGALRRRYSELVRRYHPDRNGGDRSHEAMLQKVIAAYQQLRKAPAFA